MSSIKAHKINELKEKKKVKENDEVSYIYVCLFSIRFVLYFMS